MEAGQTGATTQAAPTAPGDKDSRHDLASATTPRRPTKAVTAFQATEQPSPTSTGQ